MMEYNTIHRVISIIIKKAHLLAEDCKIIIANITYNKENIIDFLLSNNDFVTISDQMIKNMKLNLL